MPTMPGMEGDTTVWYASYWKFIVAYSNNRFGDNWCLTPEESLDFYAGETVAPTQLIIRSSKASNNIVSLKHGDSMLDITATMPAHIVVEQRYGLRLYPLAEALVFCTPTYFSRNSVNARTCLSLVGGADEILKVVADEGNSSRASRLVGAFRNIGRTDVAETILQFMTRLGHELRPEDPFEDTTPSLSGTSRNTSPHAIRIRLMWQKMRKQILDLPLIAPTQSQTTEAILSNMDDNYIPQFGIK